MVLRSTKRQNNLRRTLPAENDSRSLPQIVATLFGRPLRGASIRAAIVALALAGSLGTASTYVFADDPPRTPTQAANGLDGTRDALTDVGDTVPVEPGWGYFGEVGTDGTNAPNWENPALGGQNGEDAHAGEAGAVGGMAGNGGNGGILTITVTGEADFSTDYLFSLGTQGGNGGVGGVGGRGQKGGDGLYSGSVTDQQSRLEGADGGVGGTGATGSNGGAGGELNFILNGGEAIFASGISFGGTGGTGGQGGQGAQGGNGGMGGDAYASYTTGYGGDGGQGGDGGVGGKGGEGGYTLFLLNGGSVVFSGATFGGQGGDGGQGGVVGLGGEAGEGGNSLPAYDGSPGLAGLNQGDGGDGGGGGNADVTISGSYVEFVGTNYFGGQGGNGGTGQIAGAKGADGTGSLIVDSGTAKLSGDLVFRGTAGSMTVNGGTLAYDGDRTIDLGTGTFTIDGGAILSRTTVTGILTVNAGTVNGPTSGLILLDVQGEGLFLAANDAPSTLTADSFDLSSYRVDTEVVQTDNGFELVLGGGALPFEWTGGGDRTWKLGLDSDRANWDQPDFDFSTGDTANFRGQGEGDVELVGLVNPGTVNISDGVYTFIGDGRLSGGAVGVSGSGTTLTFANTTANTFEKLNIGTGGTVNASHVNQLGSGDIANNGTLNLTLDSDGTMVNILTGNGAINKNGDATLILAADNTATGTLTVNAGGVAFVDGGNYAGSLVSDADVLFEQNANSVFTGNVSGDAAIVKWGTGALTLAGANSNTGGVEINAGSVVVDNDHALAGKTTVSSNGTLDVNGYHQDGEIELNNGSLVNNGSTYAYVYDLTVTATSKIGGSGVLFVDKALTGNIGIEKIGTGNVILTADNDYTGGTIVSEGILTLGDGDTTGNVLGDVLIAEGACLVIDRTGDLAADIEGAGWVSVFRDTTFTGINTYTGQTTVNGATVTGNLSATSKLHLLKNATFDLGGADRRIKFLNGSESASVLLGAANLTITDGGNFGGTVSGAGDMFLGGEFEIEKGGTVATTGTTTVTGGATLEVTATLDAEDAAFQGGSLVLESGSTLKTNVSDYGIGAGGEKAVYVGSDLDGFTDAGAALETVQQKLLYKIGDLNFDNGNLYYTIKRRFGSEMFPNVSPSIWPVIDAYTDGNVFFEELLDMDSDATAERLLQSGFDFLGLGHAMSATYEAKMGVNRALESRIPDLKRSARPACNPCTPYLGQARGVKREAWVSMIYENAKGFRLNSGNFKYGYTNDLYGVAFGVDRTRGASRIGVMGVGGWGKSFASGSIAGTRNETGFGGAYGYLNGRTALGDVFVSAGWLGMNSDIDQFSAGERFRGDLDGGLASVSVTLSETFCFGGMHVTPMFGVEYGYYYQDEAEVSRGGVRIFTNEKSSANIVTLPVGVKVSRGTTFNRGRLTPEFRARYLVNVGDVTSGYKTWTIGADVPAAMVSTMSDRHAGELGLTLGWQRGRVTLSGDYGYLFSKRHQNQFVSVTGAYRF